MIQGFRFSKFPCCNFVQSLRKRVCPDGWGSVPAYGRIGIFKVSSTSRPLGYCAVLKALLLEKTPLRRAANTLPPAVGTRNMLRFIQGKRTHQSGSGSSNRVFRPLTVLVTLGFLSGEAPSSRGFQEHKIFLLKLKLYETSPSFFVREISNIAVAKVIGINE